MPSKWYYEKGGVRKGPVTSEDIRRMVANGTLLPTDLLWKEGMKDWMPAGKSTNLFPQSATNSQMPLESGGVPSRTGGRAEPQQKHGKAITGSSASFVVATALVLVVGFIAVSSFIFTRRSPQTVAHADVPASNISIANKNESITEASVQPQSSKATARKLGSNENDKFSVYLECDALTATEAKEVVDFNPAWGISFQQLGELSPEAAAELSKYKGQWIVFRKATRISPQVAEQLCRFKGELGMLGLTQVTPEFCRLFTEHQGVLNLSKVTAIDDAVATALSERHGGLDMSGLQSVSEAQLELLLTVGGPLEVSGVGSLKGYKWAELLEARGSKTVLKGNTDTKSWTTYHYNCLCRNQPSLFLENVHVVSDDLAKAVATKPGHISFAEDASMSPAAKAIFDERNRLLDVMAVEYLDDSLAEGIATRARMAREATNQLVTVALPRVGELNSQFRIMRNLSSFTGTLLLGIRQLSDYDAEVLGASHLSEICLPALENTSIRALCSLAKAKRTRLNLPTLLSLSDEFTHALEAHEDWLILEGLQSITDSQVESLARKQGDLKLPESLRLSERQKAILATHKKVDVLDGCWWRDKR